MSTTRSVLTGNQLSQHFGLEPKARPAALARSLA